MEKEITRQGDEKRFNQNQINSINGIGEDYLSIDDEKIYSLGNEYALSNTESYFCQILLSNLGCRLIENIRKFDNKYDKLVLVHELKEFRSNPYLMKNINGKYISSDENQLIIMEDDKFFISITNQNRIVYVHLYKK